MHHETYTDGKFDIVPFKDGDGHVGVEIVKKSNREIIPYDEPIFILRARDRLALPALQAYLNLCEANNCTDYQLGSLERQIEVFKIWRREHADKMKQPGITEGK
jgi:hypothetical protein